MVLENKLHLTDSTELARQEEKISKQKAAEMFEIGFLDTLEVGTYESLAAIHAYLFSEIYDFAGKVRTVQYCQRKFSLCASNVLRKLLRACEHHAPVDF